jgi:hypothetical protein
MSASPRQDASSSVPLKSSSIGLLLCAALLNGILVTTFLFCFTPWYETNDDPNMQWIASGFYTGHPSEYLVFTNFLIGWALKGLYTLAPGCNWYLIYILGVHYVALTGIAFVILNRRESPVFVLLYIGFFILVEFRNLLNLQFTTTAFLVGACGLLLLVDGIQPGSPILWGRLIVGVMLITLMGMIRELVAPFLALIALPFLLERFGTRGLRRLSIAGALAVFLFVSLHTFNRWYYERDPAWRDFLVYNKLRGRILDTRLKELLPQAGREIGWTDNDAWLFSHQYFTDHEVFGSTQKIQLLASKLETLAPPFPYSAAFSLNNFLLPRLWGSDSATLLLFGALNSAICLLVAGPNRRRFFLTLVCTYSIFVGLTFYFRITTRLPERVSYNMPLLVNLICLYWATGFHTSPSGILGPALTAISPRVFPMLRRSCFALALFIATVYVWMLLGWMRALWYTNASAYYLKSEVTPKLAKVIHEAVPSTERPIFIPLFWDSPCVESLFFEWSTKRTPFSLAPYSWLPHSPIYVQVLASHRLPPSVLSLLDRSDVYFVLDESWLLPLQTFYREHHGLRVHLEPFVETDRLPGFTDCRLHLYKAQSERLNVSAHSE